MIKYIIMRVICMYLSVLVALAYEMLDDIPVTFSLEGNAEYIPSSGGVAIPGYIMRVGFNRRSWIGIKFMDLTSQNNYDIVVVKRESTQVGGYYEATVGEYFVSSGRQNKLLTDSVNNMDKEVKTYSNSNYFEVEIYRTKGHTNGEDWEGGDFVHVCFVTSSTDFVQEQWEDLTESCYGYEITDYISTFRGSQITSMKVDQTNSDLYGGIDGPLLQLMLFWYRPNATLSHSEVLIKFNHQVSEQVGFDYFSCTTGDKFGPNQNSLEDDLSYSGYNDGTCVVTSAPSSTKISYHRYLSTFDDFDTTIYEQNQICIIVGDNQNCKNITLNTLYPIMDVESEITIFSPAFHVELLLMIICFIIFI